MPVKNYSARLLALMLILFSCRSGNNQNILDVNAFKARMEQQPQAVVVDVRTADEFSDGHLPGALNIDVKNPSFGSQVHELDTAKTIMLYCHSGGRSRKAAEIMEGLGFRKVMVMKGGFLDWQHAGFPVEKDGTH